jgi:trehalose 6-phosphate synthase
MDRTGRVNDVVVLAHRAPASIPSGVVTALEPLVRRSSALWVAHGGANADPVAAGDREHPMPPPANQGCRVHAVAVPDDEHKRFYLGFANEGLWPICHDVDVVPIFRNADFRMYRHANERFASAVHAQAAETSIVFVQDYHFALVPRLLRQRSPARTLAAFWHIPWPRPRVFRICPYAVQLVDGLLGSDLIGLQTPDDVENFLGFCELMDGATVDRLAGEIRYRGATTTVRCYPAGIDWANRSGAAVPSPPVCRDDLVRRLRLPAEVRIGVGVDRLDYTKGIKEKFVAIEKLLERRRDLRGRFAFVQVAEPSRGALPAYRLAREEIVAVRDRVNARFGLGDGGPIHLLERHHTADEVRRLYRAADVCYVASLRDGMNLVAKEFVAARDDEQGVLILSQFAGAARQLGAAMLVNPRVIGEAANTMARALAMPPVDQRRRMRLLRSNVMTFDASWWATSILRDAADRRRPPASARFVPSPPPAHALLTPRSSI